VSVYIGREPISEAWMPKSGRSWKKPGSEDNPARKKKTPRVDRRKRLEFRII
jgi:hypothetical protein